MKKFLLLALCLACAIPAIAETPYATRADRLATVRLERHEWVNIVTVAQTEIGEAPLKAAFIAALGEERAAAYIEQQAGEPFTKQDTHALVRQLYPLVPGDTREAKTDWVIAQAKRCFVKVEGGVAVPDEARIAQVINYALDRVEEFEAAGGTLEKFPEPPPPPEPPASEFPDGVKWLYPDVSAWPATATLSAGISGGQIRLDYDKARAWPTVDDVVANCWVFYFIDGAWYAGTFEYLRPGQISKPLGTLDGSLGDHVKREPMSGYLPASGDPVGLMVSGLCRGGLSNVKERSNLVWTTWP